MFSPLFQNPLPDGARRGEAFAVMSRFVAPDDTADGAKEAFRLQPNRIEQADGFIRMEVLRPCDRPQEFWLMTLWTDRASYRLWHYSVAGNEENAGMPPDLVPARGDAVRLEFDHVSR
jgi:heme-degrading monooxygenase HmoA